MKITVEDIRLSVWEEGYPKWFHIEQCDDRVSFTLKQASAVRDALSNLIKCAELGERV